MGIILKILSTIICLTSFVIQTRQKVEKKSAAKIHLYYASTPQKKTFCLKIIKK